MPPVPTTPLPVSCPLLTSLMTYWVQLAAPVHIVWSHPLQPRQHSMSLKTKDSSSHGNYNCSHTWPLMFPNLSVNTFLNDNVLRLHMKYWVYFGILIIFGLYLYPLLSPSSFPSLFNNLSSVIFHIYFITFLFPRVTSFPMLIFYFSSFMQTHTPTHPFFSLVTQCWYIIAQLAWNLLGQCSSS